MLDLPPTVHLEPFTSTNFRLTWAIVPLAFQPAGSESLLVRTVMWPLHIRTSPMRAIPIPEIEVERGRPLRHGCSIRYLHEHIRQRARHEYSHGRCQNADSARPRNRVATTNPPKS